VQADFLEDVFMDHGRDDKERDEESQEGSGTAELGGKKVRDEKKPTEKNQELDDDEQPVGPLQPIDPPVQDPDSLLVSGLSPLAFDSGLHWLIS
jgi:hypothetical protein